MKNIVSKISIMLTAAAMMLFAAPHAAVAQPSGPGNIEGHAQNPLGVPFPGGTVKLSTDLNTTDETKRHFDYSFPMDAQGNYKGTNVTPNAGYAAFLFDGKNQLVDYVKGVEIKAGQTATINFDMTRKEYLDRMTPAEKANLEEIRKKNAGVSEANSKINNLNAQLTKARNELKTDPDDAVAIMTQATQVKPDEPILWTTLAQAQAAAGDAAFTKTKKMSDPDVQKDYHAALDAYKKSTDLELAKKAPSAIDLGAIYNGTGTVQGKLGNVADAVAAFDAAAKAQPTSSYTYYNNEAAIFYNAQKMDDAAVAADKAIAADPTKPDPYYVKAQALIGKASVDPATQKITAPPGCVEAYNKYLELAPTGAHAEEIKQILQGIGQTVNNKYQSKPTAAPKKK